MFRDMIRLHFHCVSQNHRRFCEFSKKNSVRPSNTQQVVVLLRRGSKLYLSLRLFRRSVLDLTSSLTVDNQCYGTLKVPMLCPCVLENESRLRDRSTLNLRTNSLRTSMSTLALGIRVPGDGSGSSRSMFFIHI